MVHEGKSWYTYNFENCVKILAWVKAVVNFLGRIESVPQCTCRGEDQIRSLKPMSRSTVRPPQIRRLTAAERAKLVQILTQKTCLAQIPFWRKISHKYLYTNNIQIKRCIRSMNRLSYYIFLKKNIQLSEISLMRVYADWLKTSSKSLGPKFTTRSWTLGNWWIIAYY